MFNYEVFCVISYDLHNEVYEWCKYNLEGAWENQFMPPDRTPLLHKLPTFKYRFAMEGDFLIFMMKWNHIISKTVNLRKF